MVRTCSRSVQDAVSAGHLDRHHRSQAKARGSYACCTAKVQGGVVALKVSRHESCVLLMGLLYYVSGAMLFHELCQTLDCVKSVGTTALLKVNQ